MALIAHDMNSELLELFTGGNSIVNVLNRKACWIKNNIGLVIQELSIPKDRQWIVIPVIVLIEELIAPFLRQDRQIKIMTFRQLSEQFFGNKPLLKIGLMNN